MDAREIVISSGLFETLNLQLTSGRDVVDRNDETTQPEAVLSETLASELWPQTTAVGQSLVVGNSQIRVVGVAEAGVAGAEGRFLFVARDMTLKAAIYARMSGVEPSASRFAEILNRVRGGIPLAQVLMAGRRSSVYLAGTRAAVKLLALLSGCAVSLAAIGLFGLTTVIVSSRSHEFHIRYALGASRRHIYALLATEVGRAWRRGLILGWVFSFACAGSLRRLLVGIEPRDWVTFVVVPIIVAAVAVLASLGPSIAAARVDDRTVLRDL